MRRAEHHVQRRRARLHDLGHRRDDRLVALAGSEQAEAEDDLTAVEPERGLRCCPARRAAATGRRGARCGPCRPGRHTTRSRSSAAARDMTTVVAEQRDQLRQDRALRRRGVAEHRVERRDDREPQPPHEVQHEGAVAPAPDPVLVLDGHDVDRRGVQRIGDGSVVAWRVAPDPVADHPRIDGRSGRGMERDHLVVADRRREVAGERRDATAMGFIGGDDRGRHHGRWSHRMRTAFLVPNRGGDARPFEGRG